MSKNNIILVANEAANEVANEVAIKNETQIVSELLKEKDIIKNMEEGLTNENINVGGKFDHLFRSREV